MGEIKMITFEAGVEKLCADWVVDVAKFLKRGKDATDQRTDQLRDKLLKLPVPQKTDPKDLAKIPDKINEILKKKNVRLKSMLDVELFLKIDVKTRKLSSEGRRMVRPL